MNTTKNLLILLLILSLTSPVLSQNVTVNYGSGKGEVDYLNTNKIKILEDPHPYGPLSFRVLADGFALVDSVGGKLLQFNSKGVLTKEFPVYPPEMAESVKKLEKEPGLALLISDFAPVYDKKGNIEAWWFADTMNNLLYKCSADGKYLKTLEDESFAQLEFIDVGKEGHLYVSDVINEVITIYAPDGKKLLIIPWQWSGMALSKDGKSVYTIESDEGSTICYLLKNDLDGSISLYLSLNLPQGISNPLLWWVNEDKKEAVITYTPAEGFQGRLKLAVVSTATGKTLAEDWMTPALVMNRIIDTYDFSKVWFAEADLFKAPKGAFVISNFKMPEAVKNKKEN
ncbi:MAG: hypothetical protein GX221_05195 [Candidatus Riflebacteria bacterium]|nr:hypothetical protein [Candidatus Riflebacteria bacterium]